MRIAIDARILLTACVIGICSAGSTARADRDWTSTCDGTGNGCCPPPVCNRVYIIRGAVGWWPAMHTMLARLRRNGYEPDVYLFGGVNHAVDNLAERRRCGEEAGPVRIIGYSLGGHGAVNMVTQLKDRGVTVDRLLLVECFSNATVTSNVRCCFNLYETRWSDEWNIFRGTPVECESHRTRLVNINVATDPNWLAQKSRNHFTMGDDTRVQQTLVHLLSCDCIWGRCDTSPCDCDDYGCVDGGCVDYGCVDCGCEDCGCEDCGCDDCGCDESWPNPTGRAYYSYDQP